MGDINKLTTIKNKVRAIEQIFVLEPVKKISLALNTLPVLTPHDHYSIKCL